MLKKALSCQSQVNTGLASSVLLANADIIKNKYKNKEELVTAIKIKDGQKNLPTSGNLLQSSFIHQP